MTVLRILVIAIAAFAAFQAFSRATLARGHRQVGDFVGWTAVAVVAIVIAAATVLTAL